MELKIMDVKEISSEEMLDLSGGVVDPITAGIIIGVVVGAAVVIMNDWEHFKDGLF